MDIKMINKVVKEFRKKYPSCTSADLQTAYKTCKLYQETFKRINKGGNQKNFQPKQNNS